MSLKNFSACFLALAFALAPSFAADTLEVFAIRVQFAEEKPDNSLTTGNGTFDSDVKNKDAYKLDPPGRRNSVPYWKKHFDFANAFYKKASNGNLVIKSRIFPEASSAYKLKKQIIDYNRTSRMDGEKTAEFDEARSRDYLRFVYDAVMAAHESDDSPFNIPLSKNPNTKRAFMIIHAGASRLVDGGSMGTRNADTPADFMDVYISRDVWMYLPDSLAGTAVSADSVVNGLVLDGASMDTLRTIMVMSETASQDGLNWGVNGILVNQIGRELGMPNTYDVVKGISRLGYFDAMDFAGYNAGNGFFPAMPGAWERAYMGWSDVRLVQPVAGKSVTVDVAAAGSGACEKSKSKNPCAEILKVPLSGSEYLLIENRQRSWNKEGEVSIVLGDPDESSDTLIRTVPVDSMNLVFEDSVCIKGKCSVNKKKAKGIILDVSSFDAGIPASGIAVWKVNDWYLRETLEFGVANFWGGDTLRDHQFGLSLIEADGVLSIGKTFKNALGEDTYDYGSGTDLLPHLRVADKSSKQKFDTVKTIMPTGYANTMTTQGGYTGIKISTSIPKEFRKEKTANSFMGDSVVNFAAPIITVTVSIDDGSIEGSEFPRELGFNTAVRGAAFLDNPKKPDEKILVVGAENGTLQAFSSLGDTLFVSTSDIKRPVIAAKDSVQYIPLYELKDSTASKLIGMAGNGTFVASLHEKNLMMTKVGSDGEVYTDLEFDFGKGFKATAGPMIENQAEVKLWYAGVSSDGTSWLKAKKIQAAGETVEVKLPENFVARDMALCLSEDAKANYVVVGSEDGRMMVAREEAGKLQTEGDLWTVADGELLNVACTDMDRDGVMEAVFVGSRGTVGSVSLKENVKNRKAYVRKTPYKRGAAGSSGIKDETSGIALGDINDDGYPEIVFLGDNLVYALDRFNVPLPNFPVVISRGAPVAGFFSDPLIVDVTGDDVPEILVPSADGLVYAFTGKGKAVSGQFPLSAGSFEYADSLGTVFPMSIFVADAVRGKKSAGPELYAFHRSRATAFRLQKASTDAVENAAAWTLPAGGNERTGFLDATKLKDVAVVKPKDEIKEFFMYPNPVRGGNARARFEIGAEAESAVIEIYDITGLCVFKIDFVSPMAGRNESGVLDLKQLGSDVYTARLKVKFKSGKSKQKLYRIGVVR